MKISTIGIVSMVCLVAMAVPPALAVEIWGGSDGTFTQGQGAAFGGPYSIKNQYLNVPSPNGMGNYQASRHVGVWAAANSANGAQTGEGYAAYSGSLSIEDKMTDDNDDGMEYQSATYYSGDVKAGVRVTDRNTPGNLNAFARIGASTYLQDWGDESRGTVAGTAIIESWIGPVVDNNFHFWYPQYNNKDWQFDGEGEGYAIAEGAAGFNARHVYTGSQMAYNEVYGQVDGKTHLEAVTGDARGQSNDEARGNARIMTAAYAQKIGTDDARTVSEATSSINIHTQTWDEAEISGYADSQGTAYSGAWDDSAASGAARFTGGMSETVYNKVSGIVTADTYGNAAGDRAWTQAYISQLAYHRKGLTGGNDPSMYVLAVDKPLDWSSFNNPNVDNQQGFNFVDENNFRTTSWVARQATGRDDLVYAMGKAENGEIYGVARDSGYKVESKAKTGETFQYEHGLAAGTHLQNANMRDILANPPRAGAQMFADVQYWQDAELTNNAGPNDVDMDVDVQVDNYGPKFPGALTNNDVAGSWLGLSDTSVKATRELSYSIDIASVKDLSWVAGAEPFPSNFYGVNNWAINPVQYGQVITNVDNVDGPQRMHTLDFEVDLDRNY